MAGPGVFVEFFEILNQFCVQWIEMDIEDKFEEIRIFLAYHGVISVLEKVATSFVSFVDGDGVSGHETAHDFAEWGRAGA